MASVLCFLRGHAYRVFYWLLILAFYAITGLFTQAHADSIPATDTPVYSAQVPLYYVGNGCTGSNITNRDVTPTDACQTKALLEKQASCYGGGLISYVSNTTTQCKLHYPNYFGTNAASDQFWPILQTNGCPSGYTSNSGGSGSTACIKHVYSCPADGGWTLSGSSCTRSDCVLKNGQTATSGTIDAGTNINSPDVPTIACDGTCQVVLADGNFPIDDALVGGVRHYYGNYTYIFNGESCSGGSDIPATSTSIPPDTCGAGQTMGTFNGKKICVNISTGQPAPSIPAPPQTDTTQESPPVTNEDGSSTQTTTTTHSDGSSTTTTVITAPDGTKTTTTFNNPAPGEDDKDAFCDKNPDATICKEDKSSFTGSCASGFSCEGDAIQCAIAKRLHDDRCADYASLQPFEAAKTKGEALLNGQHDTDVTNFLNRAGDSTSTVNLPSSLSESGQVSLSSAGLSDMTVSVLGRAVVLPFSQLNSILTLLGYVIMAVAYVAALRIVGVF